ncbi:MAG: hypothetical protein LAT51_13250 [Flavobacteriaceae bacterium]|nr:hypothetical protein [Flavobacteriaceae bacterium]
MKKIILRISLIMLTFYSAQSQSIFLEKGQNGFSVGGAFSSNDDATSLTGSFGYSFSGILDLGLSVGRVGFDDQIFNEDYNATFFTPSVSYLVIKQNEQIPISFQLGGAYERSLFSGKGLSANNVDITGDLFSLGASIYSMFEVSEAMKIQPGIGLNYITGDLRIEDSTMSDKESVDSTIFALLVSLVVETSPTSSFIITPNLSFGEETTTFGLSLAYVFPQN